MEETKKQQLKPRAPQWARDLGWVLWMLGLAAAFVARHVW